MSGGEAWLKLIEFAENNERVTLYQSEGVWYIEWFNLKGGFQFVSGATAIELVEELKI